MTIQARRCSLGSRQALAVAALVWLAPGLALASVTHTTGVANGVRCDIWTWTDASDQPRTVALKMEGNGNPGHGGYAVQMTYNVFNFSPQQKHGGSWQKITVNAPNESDGGFGYFVSHERYRTFADNSAGTIGKKIFGADDSPLGLNFPVTSASAVSGAAGGESFTLTYPHYGTIAVGGFDSNTGQDNPPLSLNQTAYALYNIPVTTTWVFESGTDFPRIDVAVDMSQIRAPGSATPTPGLVSFDVRGPYGVAIFDDGANGVVNTAEWGDEQYLFAPLKTPITRSSPWNWSWLNPGARYNVITAGTLPGTLYEMGLFEPTPASKSALADNYAPERGTTSATFQGKSIDMCGDPTPQTLPSDGTWPYQSVQYSLPCAAAGANYLTAPTAGKKISWGSSSFYGFNLNMVSNGPHVLPIDNFPPGPDYTLRYSVCLVLGRTKWPPFGGPTKGAPPVMPLTIANAGLYTAANPNPANSNCATAVLPALRRPAQGHGGGRS